MITYHGHNIPCITCTKTWVCVSHNKMRYLAKKNDNIVNTQYADVSASLPSSLSATATHWLLPSPDAHYLVNGYMKRDTSIPRNSAQRSQGWTTVYAPPGRVSETPASDPLPLVTRPPLGRASYF